MKKFVLIVFCLSVAASLGACSQTSGGAYGYADKPAASLQGDAHARGHCYKQQFPQCTDGGGQ